MERVARDAGQSAARKRQIAGYCHGRHDIEGMREVCSHFPAPGVASRAYLARALVQERLCSVKRQSWVAVKTSYFPDLIMDRIGTAE